jgi:vitamin B12 transporter
MQDDGLIDVGFFGFVEQRVTLDAYTLVNLAASYEVKPGVELFGRIENLLDTDYQEIYGFESAGLAAYGGVRFDFGGGE